MKKGSVSRLVARVGKTVLPGKRLAALAFWIAGVSPAVALSETPPADAPATHISSIIIYTPDMQGLAAFYEASLEIGAPANRLHNHIGYWLGANYLGFEPVDRVVPNPGGATVWFGVRDIKASLARLAREGAKPQMPATRQDFGDWHATVLDPDGNVIGLIERSR